MTYESPLTCSVLMSKFIPRISPGSRYGHWADRSRKSLSRRRRSQSRHRSRLFRLRGGLLQLLDQLLELWTLRRGRVQLHVLLECRQLDLGLADRGRGLGDVVLGLRVVRLEPRSGLVALECGAVVAARLRAVAREERARLLRAQLLQRVGAERLPERPRRQQRLPRILELRALLLVLVAGGVFGALGQLQPAQLLPG